MAARRVRDIEYQLLRSGQRRTADIIIERDGHISVRAPAHLSEELMPLSKAGGSGSTAIWLNGRT